MSNVSPNIGLPLTEENETRNYAEIRLEVSGNRDDSGFMIIDKEINDIKEWKKNNNVFSTSKPLGQNEGDTWNEIIP